MRLLGSLAIACGAVAVACSVAATEPPERQGPPASVEAPMSGDAAARPAAGSSAPHATASPTVMPAPVSAGPVPDAGVLLVRGADDAIYRYDAGTGSLERVWGASRFAEEVAHGVYAVGRQGDVALLRWDGTTERVEPVACGTGVAATVSPNGGCASSGLAGVAWRLPDEHEARVVLPPDWGAGAVALSPDGRRLLVVRTVERRPGPGMDPGLCALWLIEADGSARELYRPAGRGVLSTPRWSPDGTRAIVRQVETTSSSFAADLVGVTTVLVDLRAVTTVSLGRTRSEAWGPDGQLAFVRGGDRRTWWQKDLIVLAPDGSETRKAAPTGGPRVGLAPAWGPRSGLAWVSGPATEDYGGDGYIDGRGAGQRTAVVEEGGVAREIRCGEGRVVEGVRWSQDASRMLLLCRKPGRDLRPLEVWLHRLTDGTSAPLVRGLGSDSFARGFGFYGAQPALTSLAAWSLAVPPPRSGLPVR